MPKESSAQKPQLIRKRLAELKQRFKQVAEAWTVDDYEAFLAFYVRLLPDLLQAERCTIYIIALGTRQICSMFGTGIEKMQIQPPRRGSVAGEAISSGKGIIRNDLAGAGGYHTKVDAETGFVTRNTMCYPIHSITGHGVAGAVQILNKQQGGFTADDLTLLGEVANYLSTFIESIILNREILRISHQLNSEYERFDPGYLLNTPFIAESQAIRDVLKQVRLVADTPVNVLIQGENGTGKELIARLIHEEGAHRQGAFVAVNCAAIPENLMESEFFGFEKGAFTGAAQRRQGRFEEASGGTLFLDEIADMPIGMQPKFLRAIQEGEGSRLGSNRIIPYNFRIICAANKDLNRLVEHGEFREDLFFRLFSVEIHLPPLRERKADIAPLALAFLDDIGRLFHKAVEGFTPEVISLFETYHWPGNIRQLRREIERLVALTPTGGAVGADNCSAELRGAQPSSFPVQTALNQTLPEQVKQLEIACIEAALIKTGGNRLQAAQLLGITRQGLYKKIKRYGINRSYRL